MGIKIQTRSAKLKWTLSQFKAARGKESKKTLANLVIALFNGEPLQGYALEADELTKGLISRRIKMDKFEAKLEKYRVIDTDLTVPGLDKIILVGLGSRAKLKLGGLRRALAEAFIAARDVAESAHLVFPLIDVNLQGFTVEQYAEVVAEYATLVDYEPNHRKTKTWEDEDEQSHFKSLTLLCSRATLTSGKRGSRMGQLLGEATCQARNLVNEPSDKMTAKALADYARHVARKSSGRIKCKVLAKSHLVKRKMGGILAVNRASDDPPFLIDMRYDPPGGKTPTVIGLVGKGITFDTGGVCIKDDDGMRDMKFDMAGAAAVICAMSLMPVLKPKVSVRAIVATTDNLIGSRAMRPGEIIEMASGTTVEMQHSDAEGRLALADALHYAQEEVGCTKLIDLATLTGDVEYALGEEVSGVFSSDVNFLRQFLKASRYSGELMHELPMPDEYRANNKSDMADLTNSGSGAAGAIVAAWFLREFVNDGVPWIHVDIAGTAFHREGDGINAAGATGVGVRTLAHFLLDLKQ